MKDGTTHSLDTTSAEVLGMLRTIEAAKAAISEWENGDINIREAFHRIVTAAISRNAAA